MSSPANDRFNIMLSASGRRVALCRALQQALNKLELPGYVIATDLHLNSPAMHVADERVVVPSYRDPACLAFLVNLCREKKIGLIIPTIDPELGWYAKHADAFREVGCRINLSAAETIAIGSDKVLTHDWLMQNQFPTVQQTTYEAFVAGKPPFELPVLVKPRFGSSSIGVSICRTMDELRARGSEKNLLVQSIATGEEYTTDLFVDAQGVCRCAVPRRRLETRGGEVSKGITVRCRPVIDLARRVAETLPGAFGVMNIQIFHDPVTDRLAIIEINPRFGGGYPLSEQAGARMTQWVIEAVLGLPGSAHDQWEENLMMLRYDDAIFVPAVATGQGVNRG
jgi:carbamoyl-phosphate synthase large subunit